MHKPHTRSIALAATLCALLAGCAQPTAPPAPAQTPPAPVSAPTAAHPAAPAPGGMLQVDPARSLIAVTVRRGGALARLGHDHLVAVRTLEGIVDPARNSADLQFRLDQMTVDEAELRLAAGLEKQPSADAIDGTRHNMLHKVLDALRYPLVQIHAERAAADLLRVAITLHGVTRTLQVPAHTENDHGATTVSGTLTLRQTDFGLVPFSVLAGAMAVQDPLELRFTIVAK